MFEKIIIAFIMISALVRFLINDITEMHMFVMFIFWRSYYDKYKNNFNNG